MDPKKIVCEPNVERYYGDNPELLKKYKEVTVKGECPFCEENIKKEGFQVVMKTNNWQVVRNPFPYKGSRIHFLIIPKRHVISLAALFPKEWNQMSEIINILFQRFPSLVKGFGLAIRDGKIGGVTLYHLHFHLIAPKVKPGKGQIPVNFGIG